MPVKNKAPLPSERAAIIFDAINNAAENGEPCPTTKELSKAIRSRKELMFPALKALQEQGKIQVETLSSYRLVTICKTGKRTTVPHRQRRSDIQPKSPSVMGQTMGNVLDAIRAAEDAGLPRPSGKSMAETFGVARMTVTRALSALLEQGVISPAAPREKSLKTRATVARFPPVYKEDNWEDCIRIGTNALLKAIGQHHPERLAA